MGKRKGGGFSSFFCAEPLLSVSHSLATPETDNIYYITLYNLPPHPYPRPPIPIFRRNIFFLSFSEEWNVWPTRHKEKFFLALRLLQSFCDGRALCEKQSRSHLLLGTLADDADENNETLAILHHMQGKLEGIGQKSINLRDRGI